MMTAEKSLTPESSYCKSEIKKIESHMIGICEESKYLNVLKHAWCQGLVLPSYVLKRIGKFFPPKNFQHEESYNKDHLYFQSLTVV